MFILLDKGKNTSILTSLSFFLQMKFSTVAVMIYLMAVLAFSTWDGAEAGVITNWNSCFQNCEDKFIDCYLSCALGTSCGDLCNNVFYDCSTYCPS